MQWTTLILGMQLGILLSAAIILVVDHFKCGAV